MTNEIVKQENKELVTTAAQVMLDMDIEMKDVNIKKILLVQKQSKAFDDGKAGLGDIIIGSTFEKIGDYDHPIEIIPLSKYKNYQIFNMDSGQPVFVRYEEYKRGIQLPWDFEEDGHTMRRDECINVYVLLPSELKNMAFPKLIPFKRTSTKAGQDVLQQFIRMGMYGKPVYFEAIQIGAQKEVEGTTSYAKFIGGKTRRCTDDEMMIAKTWFELLPKAQIKVDDSDLAHEPVVQQPPVQAKREGKKVY